MPVQVFGQLGQGHHTPKQILDSCLNTLGQLSKSWTPVQKFIINDDKTDKNA